MPTCHLCVLLSSRLDVLAHDHKSVLRAHVPPSQEGNTGRLGVHQLKHRACGCFPKYSRRPVQSDYHWASGSVQLGSVKLEIADRRFIP